MTTKQERIEALERQISRLTRRITILDQRSNRYSWMRVAIFFGGIVLSIVGYVVARWWLALALALLAIIIFSVVAFFQGKIDRSIVRHKIWSYIKSTHIARMRLDWNVIPAVHATTPQSGHPFESDLDITGERSLHRLVNTAISGEGTRRLHEWLLTTNPDLQTIHTRQALVRELLPLTRFRDKLTLKSLLASRQIAEQLEGNRLTTWLHQMNGTAALPSLLWGSVALSMLTLILAVLNVVGILSPLWIASLLCSLFLFLNTKKIRGDVFEDAYYLRDAFATTSTVFEYLEKYPYRANSHLKKLCEPFFTDREHRPSLLLKGIARIANAATLAKNPYLWLPVNALVPWDTYCAYRLRRYKVQIAAYLPRWLDVWFELEALNSLAAFAYLNPTYTLPDVVADAAPIDQHILFEATALGHPLLLDEQKVTNDFTFHKQGEVVIITGSNMSGKSTFLRTLGINLCLAFTGGPVNASMFHTTLFRVFTCIKVSDSVTDGYSYFYAEVRRLKALLTALQQDGYPLFFLIDEIFKGTNNRERLIGSRSFVHALVERNCLGCISTHDLELVTLANTLPDVTNYHFREDVIDGAMVFDYRIRSGPSPTTNALKIMQLEGLPVDEIGERV
ncbi:MAG: MutS family DNA mismatch repair protein [Ktedonobacteraceae bacterium]